MIHTRSRKLLGGSSKLHQATFQLCDSRLELRVSGLVFYTALGVNKHEFGIEGYWVQGLGVVVRQTRAYGV